MTDRIIELLKDKRGYLNKKDSSCSAADAEKELRVIFSEEYKQYAEELGVASFFGHELTGLIRSEHLNVVNATERERNYNPEANKSWYVIEETGNDGEVVWQNQIGEIFVTQPNKRPIKAASSMCEYYKDK